MKNMTEESDGKPLSNTVSGIPDPENHLDTVAESANSAVRSARNIGARSSEKLYMESLFRIRAHMRESDLADWFVPLVKDEWFTARVSLYGLFRIAYPSASKTLQAVLSMDYYLQNTYYKTASLISNSCKSIAMLTSQTAEVAMLAYEYRKNLVCKH
ncbi:geranyl diphosphate synthase 1 [Tanacetum coccineum]